MVSSTNTLARRDSTHQWGLQQLIITSYCGIVGLTMNKLRAVIAHFPYTGTETQCTAQLDESFATPYV